MQFVSAVEKQDRQSVYTHVSEPYISEWALALAVKKNSWNHPNHIAPTLTHLDEYNIYLEDTLNERRTWLGASLPQNTRVRRSSICAGIPEGTSKQI